MSGLLTGSDLLQGLRGKKLGRMVLITRDMLKEETDLFLDGLSLQDVSAALGTEVVPVGSLHELYELLTGNAKGCVPGARKQKSPERQSAPGSSG